MIYMANFIVLILETPFIRRQEKTIGIQPSKDFVQENICQNVSEKIK